MTWEIVGKADSQMLPQTLNRNPHSNKIPGDSSVQKSLRGGTLHETEDAD